MHAVLPSVVMLDKSLTYPWVLKEYVMPVAAAKRPTVCMTGRYPVKLPGVSSKRLPLNGENRRSTCKEALCAFFLFPPPSLCC